MTRACNVADGDDCRPPTTEAAMLDGGECGPPTPGPAMLAAGLSTYPGGKNGAGVWQRLISLMPPHRVYIEAFLGSGAIMRRKRRAAANVGIDVDERVINGHRHRFPGQELVCADALEWLQQRCEWRGDELIYCDPPYLGSSRSDERPRYRHEMLSEHRHREFLQLVTSLPTRVMVSGYPSALYEDVLYDWSRLEYTSQTRGGPKREVVWMNYPEPTELHDYRFLGADYHDRGRLKRKINRWVSRLQGLPTLERSAILAALKGEA